MATPTTTHKTHTHSLFRGIWRSASWRWRIVFGFMALIVLQNVLIIGLSTWYRYEHRTEQTVLGTTFIDRYATHFGLDPDQTLDAILNDLGVRKLRLVSYWDEIETQPGTYDFTKLDKQFRLVNTYGAKVSLAIGLRQPRWPECHMPNWAMSESKSVWQPQLEKFMTAVVEHYKDNPALESYQLENEFFLKAFGECPDFSRDRLVSEYELVKKLDAQHPVIVSRSNNAMGWPINKPTPDQYGVSVYKRVWDKTITHRYFEYPFPARFYGMLAALSQLTQGRSMIVHELQSEAWGPVDILDMSITEQNKTMDGPKLSERIDYGISTGMKEIDLWGVEYWYYRQQKLGDSSLWNAAKQKIADHRQLLPAENDDLIHVCQPMHMDESDQHC